MDEKKLKKIFLSASIPLQDRNPIYFESADVISIRDSVRALAAVVIPEAILVWGGHPSITPMIRIVLERLKKNVPDHVKLYQSRYFEKEYPEDNSAFGSIIYTDLVIGDVKGSINIMRTQMFNDNIFSAGIFIGGMEGIEEEFKMFQEYNPSAPTFPIASSGGASNILFKRARSTYSPRLLKEYTYMSIFNELIKPLL